MSNFNHLIYFTKFIPYTLPLGEVVLGGNNGNLWTKNFLWLKFHYHGNDTESFYKILHYKLFSLSPFSITNQTGRKINSKPQTFYFCFLCFWLQIKFILPIYRVILSSYWIKSNYMLGLKVSHGERLEFLYQFIVKMGLKKMY